MRRVLASILLLAGCSGGSYAPGSPTPAMAGRPDDRVLLGDFSRVMAVASSFDRVYVAYSSAIAIWRPQMQRWDVPRTPPYPTMLQDVFAATIDPTDHSVWLATSTGYVRYQPDIDRWDSGTIPGRVTGIADDPENGGLGIWFRTSNGWMLQPRFGPATPGRPRVSLRMTPTINEAFADIPQLRPLSSRVLTGPLMQQGSFTAAAPSTSGNGWYLGTTNRGLLFFDRTANEPQQLSLGLPGTVVGAITGNKDGVWVVNDLTARTPAAITYLSEDLGVSSGIPGSAVFGLPFDAARQIAGGDRVLWLATEKGLVRVSLEDGKVARWDTPQGLPSSRVISLGQRKGQMVAGTMRGLVTIDSDDKVTRMAPSFDGAIYAMKSNGDTLWVGTSYGLYASLIGDDSLRMPEGFRQQGAIPPVLGVGYVADTLVVMTPDHLVWRSPSTGAWTRGPDLGGTLGQLTAFAATSTGVWVGGTRGAGFVRPTTPAIRPLFVGKDLPGEVTSITATDNYLWIGTVAGLLRVRLLER